MVNTRGGVVHFTGIAWAGGAGEPVDRRDGRPARAERSSPASSPAPASRSRASVFERARRLRRASSSSTTRTSTSRCACGSAAGALGVEPAARVDHDYEFAKGPAKWRRLERNRWATLIRTYPAALLALLAPALLATELALVPVSIAGGWFGAEAARLGRRRFAGLPRLLRERRGIQAERAIGAGEFAAD